MLKSFKNISILLLGFFCLMWVFFPFLENTIIYHPEMYSFKTPVEVLEKNFPELATKVKNIYFKSLDGTELNAWYVLPAKNKPMIVFAHGNAGNMADRISVMQKLHNQGYGVFMFDYRGYGLSQGNSSEKGIYKDFEAASNYVYEVLKFPRKEQIAMGGSLGSAVVVDVASRLEFKKVVIFSVFTSGIDFAREGLEYFPWGLYIRQHFDSLSKIDKIKSPLIIMQGKNDKMMPYKMAEKLYAKSTALDKKILLIDHAGHNDVFYTGFVTLLEQLSK